MKIFVASAGEYADKYIVGVFSDREKAEKCLESYLEEEVDIEKFELDWSLIQRQKWRLGA